MSDRTDARRTDAWPRRDAKGRIPTLRHLLEAVGVLLVIGIVAVAVIDVVSAWIWFGELGDTSGWLGGLMAFWLYVEEFRAWRGAQGRLVMALLGGPVALGLGIVVSGLPIGWPALLNGAVGVTVAALGYALIWYHGIRLYVDREVA